MGIDAILYQRYLGALLSGDKPTCMGMVQGLLDTGVAIKDIYDGLFRRSMYEVGELWEYNKISVAIEHIATSITEGLLLLMYPRIFAAPKIGKRIVVSCVANEYHQIGGKMVCDFFELNGWDGYFVGANAPLDDTLSLIDAKKPDLIGLSVSVFINMQVMYTSIEAIRKTFPSTELLVGGQAFRRGAWEQLKQHPDVCYIESIEALEAAYGVKQ